MTDQQDTIPSIIIQETSPAELPGIAGVQIAVEEPAPMPIIEQAAVKPAEAVTGVPPTAVEVPPKSREELARELEEAVKLIAAYELVMQSAKRKDSSGGSLYTILQEWLDEEIKNRDYLTTKLAEIPTVEPVATVSVEPIVSPIPAETTVQVSEPTIPPITETIAPVETVQNPMATVPPENPATGSTGTVNETPPLTAEQKPQKRGGFFGLFQKKTPPPAPVQSTSTTGTPVQINTDQAEKYSP